MGVSIENRRWTLRANYLRTVPAAVRFVSAEPLLGKLDGLDLTGIDWLIAGGEPGPRHRSLHADWVRDLRDRCGLAGVAPPIRVPRARATLRGWGCPVRRRQKRPRASTTAWSLDLR